MSREPFPRFSRLQRLFLILALLPLGLSAACSDGDGADAPVSDVAENQDADAGDEAAEEAADEVPTAVGRGAPLPTDFATSEPEPTPDSANPGPVVMTSPDYGVQAFLWWRPEIADRDLGMVQDMQFRWVKQIFGWRDIELFKGEFDWSRTDRIVDQAEQYGIQLMIRVDHQPPWAREGCSMMGPPDNMADWTDFLKAVAERYEGRIDAYQIWNEPNLAREWCDSSPSPEGYAEMLRASYGAIKAVDPRALVISAGLSPTGSMPPVAMPDDMYLDRLYQAMDGTSEGHFDLLGVHAAGFAAPPEISPEEAAANKDAYGGERFFTFRRVEDLRAIQESYGDGDTRVAILEMGWTSDTVNPDYAWHAVSEETKADYLVRAYQYAEENWTPWIGVMSTIFICDHDWNQSHEQYWWCITDPGEGPGSPRPGFNALKAMEKVQP